ncbi:2-deoxyglucose-6-phosphate phosphatase [compost metagenome]
MPHGKPAPDVYLEAALQLGVEPQECLVLEDSRNGIVAAKAAGMGCIGYVNLNSGNQDLSQADSIVKKIADINLEDWN